jgi:hypothetical protein
MGVARFDDLGVETDFVYRVSVREGPGEYTSQDFQFPSGGKTGLRVTIPLYPASAELSGLVLLSRGLMSLSPEEDHFVIDVRWRIENYSDVSWVPQDVSLTLPEDFEALDIGEDGKSGRL